MKRLGNIIEFMRKNSYFIFVYVPLLTMILLLTMLLLYYPQAATIGVSKGIDICLESLIPSLFPFLFVSTVMMNYGIFDKFSAKVGKLSKLIFDLPGDALPIIIMSVIGGFPIGAVLIKEAFEQGKISAQEGKRMLLFCVNPGPAFTISFIGCSLIGNSKAGLTVYVSTVLSSLTIGIISRFFSDEDDLRIFVSEKTVNSKAVDVLNNSISSCINNTLNICTWVIIFSCIGALIDVLPVTTLTSDFIKMISEVTNGAMVSVERFSLPVLCAVIGFSGFCIHFQIMPSLISLKLRYKYFLCSRIISSGLSCIICYILLQVFPEYIQTVSLGTKPEKIIFPASVPLCIFLMLLCSLFIIGDSYVVIRNSKNINDNKVNKPYLY